MNAVPGMTTSFKMVPTITTDSMRLVMKDEAFDFILLCNKICGASPLQHADALVVDRAGTYDAWYAEREETVPGPADGRAPRRPTLPRPDSTSTTVDSTASCRPEQSN
jgi:heme/copper-type cytochrome/quinol oxidase subunit 2